MKPIVYIRPLTLADASVSHSWRNDPEVWKYTEFKPDRYISLEMEREWLNSKLSNKDEKRFAICLKENHQYIGNIQLLNMDTEKAWYHLFIGEKMFWGKGISQKATYLLLCYAFSELDLKTILLEVNVLNHAARAVYDKMGFTVLPYTTIQKVGFTQMKLDKADFIYRENSNC